MRPLALNPTDDRVFSHVHDTVANPGAGNPINYPCPPNARIRLTSFVYRITNIGTTAWPIVQIIDTAANVITIAASKNKIQNIHTEEVGASVGIKDSVHLTTEDELRFGLPDEIFVEPGETLRFTVPNLTASQSIINFALSYDLWVIA